MGKRRAKTAFCSCLIAVGSSRAYAFGPSILRATALDGGLSRRARGADATAGRNHLPASPSPSPSSSSSRRGTCRVRSDVRGRRSGLYGSSGGAGAGGSSGGGGGMSGSTSTGNANSITADGGDSSPGGVGPAIAGQITAEAAGVGTGGAGVGAGGGGGRRSYLAGRSRPAMAFGQATQEQQEKAATAAAAAVVANTVIATNRTERGQRLRAVNWVKQVRNELTSAEFALNLNGAGGGGVNGQARGGVSSGGSPRSSSSSTTKPTKPGATAAGGSSSSKVEIDFDSYAERLEGSLRALQAGRPVALLEAVSEDELREITERLKVNLAKIKKITQAEGRTGTDSAAVKGTSSTGKDGKGAGEGGSGEEGGSWRDAGGILGDMKEGINVNLKDVKVPEFDLFVRDDGTVDWDGAIQSGREVARFGQELWDRINGQNPNEEGGIGGHGAEKAAKEIPEDCPVMLELSAIGTELSNRQEQLEKELDAFKAEARAQESNWTALERRNANRRIRDKAAQLNNAKRQLQLHRIDVDMERICYNIEQEIRESTATSLSEYRLLVAEFGLLDAQLANLTKLVAETTGEEAEDSADGLVIDEDELELVSREVLDLKNRLGLDLENPALSVDPEKVTRYVKESYDKIKGGLDFYLTGTKILGNDIGYALTLVSKAVQGSILKPREVRTLRRTAKDCVTFIPFVIILILPLTPVGHVLVFSFIQRFFPNFFPSTYTDRRQNLLKMYTEVEKKVDWDDSGRDGGDDILENLRRNFISTLNQAGDSGNKKAR
eukprot:g3769.t1